MLLGVLDADSKVLWESREASTGQTEDELVELLVREVGEAKDARPGVEAVGLGIPATVDHDKGIARSAVNLPLEEPADPRARLGTDRAADLRRQRRQRRGAGREPLRRGEGGAQRGDADDRHRNRRRPDPRRRDLPRLDRRRGRARPHGDRPRWAGLPGQLPRPRLRRDLASGTALGREGRVAAEREPESVLGAMLAAGETIDGKAVTEAALSGDATARGVFDLVGSRLGVALTSFANIFEPEVFVIGGGVIAAGDLLLDPARRELREARPAPDEEDPGGGGRARLGRRHDRRRGDGADRARARQGLMPGGLSGLPDADRQPRRRHPAGPRGAGRRRLDRLRGHAPHRRRCSTSSVSGRRRRWSPTTRATKARARPSWRSGSSAATRSRWSPTRACRRSPTLDTS